MTNETHCLSPVMPDFRWHPRLKGRASSKTWMAGTSPAMTNEGFMPGHDE
jgi:hypothetical protein